MTAFRIPEEPFAPESPLTFFRVRGAKVTKISSLSYALMEIPGLEGEPQLARVGPSYLAWFQRGSLGPAPEEIDFGVSGREIEAASQWANATSPRRRSSVPESPAGSPTQDGAGLDGRMKTWGVHTWGKSEIDFHEGASHCQAGG